MAACPNEAQGGLPRISDPISSGARRAALLRDRLFIINPAAGGARALSEWEGIRPELRRRGLEGDFVFTSQPGEAFQIAAKAAFDYRVLVAVGGDGTAFEVASGLLAAERSPATLGILPFGTGNDTAESLGLSSMAAALQALAAGMWRKIDAIRVTCRRQEGSLERHALLFAAAGIVGPVLRTMSPVLKRMLGRSFAYRVAAIRALLTYPRPAARLRCDDQDFQERFLYVGAHNAETFGGGMRVAPGARLDDGLLNFVVVSALGRVRAIGDFRRLCQGTHTNHPGIRYLPGRSLFIDSCDRVEIAADGDCIGWAPATFTVAPRILSVLTLPSAPTINGQASR